MAEHSLHNTPEFGVQGELPFDESFLFTKPIPLEEFQQWPGYVAMEAAAQAHDRLKADLTDTVLAPPSFIGRWALRAGLPALGAWAALHIPYTTTIDGLSMRVQGSLFSRPGFSADTTLGNWEFPNADGLPIGVHLSPENVNGIEVAKQANPDIQAYTEKLRSDVAAEIPTIAGVLGAELLGGLVVGAGVGAAVNRGIRQGRGLPAREYELRYRAKQAGALLAVTTAIASYGVASWNPNWAKDSRLTGTLAEAQAINGDLGRFYDQKAKAYEVTQAIIAIQSSLQENLDNNTDPTAFNAMYISDMHGGTTYPLLAQYVEAYDVKLIIDTGDESNFGTRAEMTPEYIAAIRKIAKKAHIIWVAGNHDSPETVAVMRSIPGVFVLGEKKRLPDNTFKIGAQVVNVYGLNIGGLPDPRVYGGEGAYGDDDGITTHKLETQTVQAALQRVALQGVYFDTFATHEPIAAEEIAKILTAEHLRQTNAGHYHEQNEDKDIQKSDIITLVEGSSSGGGLESTGTGSPIEFTIASFAANCQETKLLRYHIDPSVQGDDSIEVHTIYLRPQRIAADRVCGLEQGIGSVQDIIPGVDESVQAAGPRK